jgi:regulatory protein YycI of two-component signal transduction system YycFG
VRVFELVTIFLVWCWNERCQVNTIHEVVVSSSVQHEMTLKVVKMYSSILGRGNFSWTVIAFSFR